MLAATGDLALPHLVTWQVQNWNISESQLQCPLRWPHCLFSLPNLYTSSSLYSCNVWENKRDGSVPQGLE